MHYLTTPTMASREGRKEGEVREGEKTKQRDGEGVHA